MCCISFHSSIVICIILQISLLSIQRFTFFCTSYSSKYCFPYSMISIEIPCSICMFIKHIILLLLFLHFTNQIITNNRFLSFLYAHPISIQVLLFQWLCSLSPISWNAVVYHSFTTYDNSPIIGMLFV